jgi:uracil-DNA glycosylase
MAMVHIGNDWDELLKEEFQKEGYQNLRKILKKEYSTYTIYPSMYDIFNALKYTSYHDVKVVILGQDPYHGPGQAHGLSFSVQKGVATPPSLVNIYKEIQQELGIEPPKHGCLVDWAKQGVLLLNTVLTVREHQPNSHRGIGWEEVTDAIIRLLNDRQEPMVFMLWGANAKAKRALITNPNHLVLTAAHPSPLSAHHGFFGCGHFAKVNEFLSRYGKAIDWKIKEE